MHLQYKDYEFHRSPRLTERAGLVQRVQSGRQASACEGSTLRPGPEGVFNSS